MKHLIVVFIVSLTSLSTSAQQLIFKAGLTISRFAESEWSKESELKSAKGFHGGLGVNIPMGERFSLLPEIIFIQKGAKSNFNGKSLFIVGPGPEGPMPEDIEIERDVNLNYLEMPLLVKWATGKSKAFHVYLGPGFAYLLGGKVKYLDNSSEYGLELSFRDRSIIFEQPQGLSSHEHIDQRLDVTAQMGIQIIFGNSFLLDVRYSAGLTPFVYDSYTLHAGKTRNNTIQFSLGIPVSLSRKNNHR